MTITRKPFCLPIKTIENARMKLIPFEEPLHGRAFLDGLRDHPNLLDYMPVGKLSSTEDLTAFMTTFEYTHDDRICFAIIIKETSTGEKDVFAGTIGYLFADKNNLGIEIGFVIILPEFHGTFVATNAVGLLISYALDQPPNGLGFRRCVWHCHAENKASLGLAKKTLFTLEGIQRFEMIMPFGKPNNGYDTSHLIDCFGKKSGPSRDSAMLAHYCDEWNEKRPQLMELMNSR